MGSQARGSVLVADDSRVVAAVIASYLEHAGYEVRVARDGAEALRRLDTEAFDVVITDLGMPVLDGFGLLEAVRARAEMTEVIADGRPTRSVAIKLEDPARVLAAVREMGLGHFENLSYPRGLKRLLGLAA